MNKCPRCNCEATGENRLVTDSCGHTKCRLCLVADVSDCLECRVARQEEERARIQQTKEKERTPADKCIIVTDKGYHCTVCKKDFRSRTQQYYHLACGWPMRNAHNKRRLLSLFLTIIQFISVIKIPPAKIQSQVLFRYVT